MSNLCNYTKLSMHSAAPRSLKEKLKTGELSGTKAPKSVRKPIQYFNIANYPFLGPRATGLVNFSVYYHISVSFLTFYPNFLLRGFALTFHVYGSWSEHVL